jgi:hypothetical protein
MCQAIAAAAAYRAIVAAAVASGGSVTENTRRVGCRGV